MNCEHNQQDICYNQQEWCKGGSCICVSEILNIWGRWNGKLTFNIEGLKKMTISFERSSPFSDPPISEIISWWATRFNLTARMLFWWILRLLYRRKQWHQLSNLFVNSPLARDCYKNHEVSDKKISLDIETSWTEFHFKILLYCSAEFILNHSSG